MGLITPSLIPLGKDTQRGPIGPSLILFLGLCETNHIKESILAVGVLKEHTPTVERI